MGYKKEEVWNLNETGKYYLTGDLVKGKRHKGGKKSKR